VGQKNTKIKDINNVICRSAKVTGEGIVCYALGGVLSVGRKKKAEVGDVYLVVAVYVSLFGTS
jgi:hypothetical protein